MSLMLVTNVLLEFLWTIVSLIPKFLYFVIAMMSSLVDIMQLLLRKVAGLSSIYYQAGGGSNDYVESKNDLVLNILKEDAIKDMFLSMLIFGIILLLVFTFIAVIKSEVTATSSKEASKGNIIGNAIKSIFMFAIVPVTCLFGLFLSNQILVALDGITQSQVQSINSETSAFNEEYSMTFFGQTFACDAQPFSSFLFKAAAFTANRIRYDEDFAKGLESFGNDENGPTFGGVLDPSTQGSTSQNQTEIAASNLDLIFANGYTIKTNDPISFSERIKNDEQDVFDHLDEMLFFQATLLLENESLDKNNVSLVFAYYDLWRYNFVIGFAGVIVVGMLFFTIVIGIFKRMFELIILLLISPLIIPTRVLDGGGKMASWTKLFVSKTLACYGPVLAINLFFIIVPFINNIFFFGVGDAANLTLIGGGFADYVIQFLFIIVGLVSIKNISAFLSNISGGEDAAAEGGAIAGEVVGTGLKALALATGTASVASFAHRKVLTSTARFGKNTLTKKGREKIATGFKNAPKNIFSKTKELVAPSYRKDMRDAKAEEKKNSVERKANDVLKKQQTKLFKESEKELAKAMKTNDVGKIKSAQAKFDTAQKSKKDAEKKGREITKQEKLTKEKMEKAIDSKFTRKEKTKSLLKKPFSYANNVLGNNNLLNAGATAVSDVAKFAKNTVLSAVPFLTAGKLDPLKTSKEQKEGFEKRKEAKENGTAPKTQAEIDKQRLENLKKGRESRKK